MFLLQVKEKVKESEDVIALNQMTTQKEAKGSEGKEERGRCGSVKVHEDKLSARRETLDGDGVFSFNEDGIS